MQTALVVLVYLGMYIYICVHVHVQGGSYGRVHEKERESRKECDYMVFSKIQEIIENIWGAQRFDKSLKKNILWTSVEL